MAGVEKALINMKNEELEYLFREHLSTPLMTDACIRNGFPLRLAPFGIHPIVPGWKLAGSAIGVKHFGSVDVFIERIHSAKNGDILVIDNEGRTDEGCIGDLTVLEALNAKMKGIVLWGVHRDTTEIINLNLPVFSFGAYPLGPVRNVSEIVDEDKIVRFGDEMVTGDDYVFADEDGVTFVHQQYLKTILDTAAELSEKERRQADQIKQGKNLYQQFAFDKFLDSKKSDPGLSFRAYLKKIGGAIEE
jgi:4-hydroxy-4-methyl-2-oxoglutarate aldolase